MLAVLDGPGVTGAQPRPPAKLSVQGIRKSFVVGSGEGRFAMPVLGGVSFSVRPGEIVSLIGESGCGKTTLLRIVQGLVRHDAGSILIDDRPVSGPGRDRGFVFQQATLLPWRTARDNITFGPELQGTPAHERRAIADRLLDLVGLRKFADQYPHQLSGGMQQRIGLARALAISPAILLMDEPFSALDAQTREVLQAELMRIHAETRQTILFVTHDLDEAIYLSDRVVVLAPHPGRVCAEIDIAIARPRPALPDLRVLPEFQEIRTRMWRAIRAADAAAPASA